VVAQVDPKRQWLLHRGPVEGRDIDVDRRRVAEQCHPVRDIVHEQFRLPMIGFDTRPQIGQVIEPNLVGRIAVTGAVLGAAARAGYTPGIVSGGGTGTFDTDRRARIALGA
jgi:hypothetical protein